MPSVVAMPGWRKSQALPTSPLCLPLCKGLCWHQTPSHKHRSTGKDLCPLWDVLGSQLHFSSSLKDPAICLCFQGPPACQRDGQGCQLSEDLLCARGWLADGQVVEIPRGGVDAGGNSPAQAQLHPQPPHWLCPGVSSPTRLRVSSSRSPPHSALLHFSCRARAFRVGFYFHQAIMLIAVVSSSHSSCLLSDALST